MNCKGCGVDLDPTEEQVNQAVDQILDTSLDDAVAKGGVCPLCGQCKNAPPTHRKPVLFALLVTLLVAVAIGGGVMYRMRHTERYLASRAALERLNSELAVTNLIGKPLNASNVTGLVRHDETGWKEVQLDFLLDGPLNKGSVHAIGGQGNSQWTFTTLEVLIPQLHKKIDVISGTIVEYDPKAYVDVHTQSSRIVDDSGSQVATPAPSWDGNYPCVYAELISPTLGHCNPEIDAQGPTERFEADLRYGSFTLRETDLLLNTELEIPFTRTYNSVDWVHPNRVHAFGQNTNHPFDIVPLGTRNPYTYLLLALEDGNIVYFPRMSKGSGYSDAVYRHSETSGRYYGSTIRWNGRGWTLALADGSRILFPESYSASNMAQGAPIEIDSPQGQKVELRRDGKRDLQDVIYPSGAAIHFTYDDKSRIIRAEADKDHWAAYEYNSDGMLSEVRRSTGQTRRFTYSGNLMTSVVDERGITLVRNTFRNSTLVEQEFSNGQRFRYDYKGPAKQYFAELVVVTLPDGSKSSIPIPNSVPLYLKLPPR